MEVEMPQQFCLRWNNYQTTINHVFHKLYTNGTFVDVTLVVEGQKIDCHKIILSACSTYFEQLLSDHSSHPHPLILLHDIPYSPVKSLVSFMYNGEINVNHSELAALLRVADILKVKGLADSTAISDFAKFRLLGSEITVPNVTPQLYPSPFVQDSIFLPQTTAQAINAIQRENAISFVRAHMPQNFAFQNSTLKRSEPSTRNGIVHPKKRARHESPTSLPPSPPISLGDSQNHEQARASPQDKENNMDEVKIEIEEETDSELQIDLSAGQSPEESAESDSLVSNRNTPVADFESDELRERHETAQSLAAMAQGAFHSISPAPPLLLAPKTTAAKVKEEKTGHGGKNGEKAYTFQDLEEGIEAVLSGVLTPAKAIAKYKIPRRTFFRRLSSVRKMRGIPSSKENASENYHNSKPNTMAAALQANRNLPVVLSGLPGEDSFRQAKGGLKLAKDGLNIQKKESRPQELSLGAGPGNVFSLLHAAAGNPSYDYYMKCLNLQSHFKEAKDIKKENVDDNSNISTEPAEQALALVTHNGS